MQPADETVSHTTMTTACVPRDQQFAFWRDGFRGSRFGLGSEPLSPVAEGFWAEGESWCSPSLTLHKCRAESLLVFRGRPELSARSWDSIWVYHQRGPGARYTQGDRSFDARTDDLVLLDADQPFSVRAPHPYGHDVWMLPKPMLDLYRARPTSPLWAPLAGHDPIASLIAAYLTALGATLPALPASQRHSVTDSLVRLLAVAAGAPAAEHRGPTRAALAERARQHAASHLPDPDLSAAHVAAAIGVSERTLQLAFQEGGESFGKFLTRRRLAACRSMLADPAMRGRSVTDIAFACGFRSLATFYREFRRQHDAAPNDLRPARPAERTPAK
jgi:AraC-like DNA-binding protein